MPESLLAAQREAIAEAIRDGIVRSHSIARRASDLQTDQWLRLQHEADTATAAVEPLVGAWLVDAVQAERERAVAAINELVRFEILNIGAHGETRWLVDREAVLAVVSRDTRSSSDDN